MRMYQIKSSWYYVFWGAMAVAVVGGQIYVGLGYREMAKSQKNQSVWIQCITPPGSYNKTGEFE